MIIAIFVCNSIYINTLKLQQISLIAKSIDTYNSSNSRYITKELQETLAEIVMSMRNRDMTIGIYMENIILHHLETYKDEINRLAEMKFKKLL